MSYHADKKRESELAAEKALRESPKSYTQAMRHMAEAAQHGFKLAEQLVEQGQERIAEQYVQEAHDLISRAEEAKSKAENVAKKAKADSAKKPSKEQSSDAESDAPTWLLPVKPDVAFDDIIGLVELKDRINRFLTQFDNPDEVAKWPGARLGDRILLCGPPGNGKTMFASAIASEIDADFFQVKGSNVMSKWVGDSQKNVKLLFDAVRASKRAVLFLDEMDGLLGARGSSSTVRNGVVSEFLQEMEGLTTPNSSVLFIGATNLPDQLDGAVLSRFGGTFLVSLPTREDRLTYLQREFGKFPYGFEEAISLEDLADRLEGHSMRDLKTLLAGLSDMGIDAATAEDGSHAISHADVEAALKTLPAPLDAKALAKYERYGS
jgi:SpoVK/Ycf46/Vps4 family AAA+-type ATPase